ncbi:Crp/Fnr family transcriptional regulator [Olivibacter sitiensis]|uniref:Crp/Fnr family transcriptional regulator n=1 Tax=Olivibacter sitiensis TaxID=376470 RepID=UPI000414FE7D|nr:Crp/Fnr family transcriptional regulator [Olivibacter sitiensis]
MSHQLLHEVYRYPSLSQSDLEKIMAQHKRISFPKHKHLLKAGQMANAYYIIESGLVRSYLYDFNDNEITTDFILEGEIANEVASLFQRIPTKIYMQALTDVTAWKIDFDIFQELFLSIPALTEWGRAWMTTQLVLCKKRATEMITDSAAQRYAQLMKEKPQIIQLAPLKHVASYLGVTDTSLSRIRKEFALSR